MEIFNEQFQLCVLFLQGQLFRAYQYGSQTLLRLRNRKDLLSFLLEDPVSSGICCINNGEDQVKHFYGFTFADIFSLEDELLTQRKDIRLRWQICQPEKKKRTQTKLQYNQMDSKTLVCSRPLFIERSNSCLGDAGKSVKELMPLLTEIDIDDDDFDSVSTTSGLYTPASTIGLPDQTKIIMLEQQLTALQKQMTQLLEGQKVSMNGKINSCPPLVAPTQLPPPPPPPPAPPLLPSLKIALNTKSNNNSLCAKLKPLESKSESKSPPLLELTNATKQQPTLTDILKNIRNVKLKKVNRSPITRTKKKALELENDITGALARALDNRRKKMKLDSDDGELDDQTKHDESVDGWSDAEEENEVH